MKTPEADKLEEQPENKYVEENSIGYIGANVSVESVETTTQTPPQKKQKPHDSQEMHACDGCDYKSFSKEEVVKHAKFVHTRPTNADEHETTWIQALSIVEQHAGQVQTAPIPAPLQGQRQQGPVQQQQSVQPQQVQQQQASQGQQGQFQQQGQSQGEEQGQAQQQQTSQEHQVQQQHSSQVQTGEA